MRWLSNRAAAQPEAGPEAYAVMPKALRLAAASLKSRAPVADKDVTKVLASEVFPISSAVVLGERAREAAGRQVEEEAAKNLRPGFKVGDKGIFVTTRELKDRNGNSIGKFNFFAAPEDMNVRDSSGVKTLLTFKNTAIELGKRKSWHGHDGCQLNFAHYEEEFFKGLKDGSAVGKWFIPFRELLWGKNDDGNKLWTENLLDLKNTGDFAGTFTTKSTGSDLARWYWSCTEGSDTPGLVWAVAFTDGGDTWPHMDLYRLSCRPCRVELVL